MPLDLNCDICGEPINEPGALWYSEPLLKTDRGWLVFKVHYCAACSPSLDRETLMAELKQVLEEL